MSTTFGAISNVDPVYLDFPHDVTITNAGLDTEYRIYGPPSSKAISGRGVLYCGPWGTDLSGTDGATEPSTGNQFIAEAVGKGDVVVAVQGGTWDTAPDPDEPDTTGAFSNTSGANQPWWDNHQTAVDAAETAYPYITEWHAVGLSWGGWSAAWFASKSTQAATDGTVRSCQLVAAVLDVVEFYNDNTGFQSGLAIGFDNNWPAEEAGLSPVDFASTDLDNCPFWFCYNGDTGTVGAPNGTDGTITIADHADALDTAIGTSAWFRKQVTYSTGHTAMGIFVLDSPDQVYGFIESTSQVVEHRHVAAETFTAYGESTEVSFGGLGPNVANQTPKAALSVGGRYRGDTSQVHSLVDKGGGGVELPTGVGYYGTWELSSSHIPNLFGTGFLFHMDATIQNVDGEAVDWGPVYGLFWAPTYTAVNAVQDMDVLPSTALRDETTFNRTGTGTWDVGTGIITVWSAPTFDTGTTIQYRVGVQIDESGGAGTLTDQAGIISALNTADATNTTQLLLGTATIPTGNYTIYSTSTSDSLLSGDLDLNSSDLKRVANIRDTNDNINLDIVNTASAVNYLRSVNAATTAAPYLESGGTDTNIDLYLYPKGTGDVVVGAGDFSVASATGDIILAGGVFDAGGSNNFVAKVGDAAGTNDFRVVDSAEVLQWNVDSDGLVTHNTGDLDLNDNNVLQAGAIEEEVDVNTTVTGTVGIPTNTHGVHNHTLTGATTYTFDNPAASGEASSFVLKATQDATGGRVITWPGSVTWLPDGTAPTVTTTLSTTSVFSFFTVDGGTEWFGSMLGTGLT